jgi:hypothetical protein
MSFNIHRVDTIKPGAWLLESSKQSNLWVGRNVDVRSESFFEGAWAGLFDKFGFTECAEVFGSGASQTRDGWLLVPPSHTLEAVYAFHDRSSNWTVSNSLAFLKRFLGFQFQDSFSALVRGFVGIVQGIDNSPTRIQTSHGTLYVLHYHNVLLGPDGLLIRKKPLPPEFNDFDSYRTYLRDTVCKVVANAGARERAARYELLATVSSGYDSPACSVLACEAGCRDAISFTSSQFGESDDGTPIAETLGLRVSTFDRSRIAGENRQFVAEMFATGTQAVDIVFEPLRNKLSGKLLVTGFHGGKIWNCIGKATSVIERADATGSSLTEFRLSESFIHFPIAFIGAIRHPEIKEIANLGEMRPYSVGGSYDKPIARRIVEGAGVRRELFGQSKKAIANIVCLDRIFLKKDVRDEIEATFENLSAAKKMTYMLYSAKFSAERFVISFPSRLSAKLGVPTGRLTKIAQSIVFKRQPQEIWEHSDPFNILALDWALTIVERQYQLPGLIA